RADAPSQARDPAQTARCRAAKRSPEERISSPFRAIRIGSPARICATASTHPEAGKESPMKRSDLTEKILDIKRENGWKWKYITDQIGGMSPVMVVGALLGQMKLSKPQAAKAGDLFGLSKSETTMLNEVPLRGTTMPPTDPLIYRFY